MNRSDEERERAYRELLDLHDEVDRQARACEDALPFALECRRGCDSCCIDGLTVFTVEAERIRRDRGDLLAEEASRRSGRCAFLDPDGVCRIYEDRPYVCRTQGLPIRWITDDGASEAVEMRDICPLSDPGELLELLEEDRCWTIGPFESRLAALQRRFAGEGGERIALRDLFR